MDRPSLHDIHCLWGRTGGEILDLCRAPFWRRLGCQGPRWEWVEGLGLISGALERKAQGLGLWEECGCLWGTTPAGSVHWAVGDGGLPSR